MTETMGASVQLSSHSAAFEAPDHIGMTPRLSLRNITKRYPGITANDHVSLDIAPGEVLAILGENGAQYAKEFTVEGINAISAQMSGSFDCDVKIRFRAPAASAHVEFDSKNTARVTFFEEQRSVTPGQFAAFYIGNEVIGGAKIAGVETQRIL